MGDESSTGNEDAVGDEDKSEQGKVFICASQIQTRSEGSIRKYIVQYIARVTSVTESAFLYLYQ